MNIKTLKEILNSYPDEMEIWVSDNDLGEGASPLESIKKELAWEANLDGDLINDEYYYVEYTEDKKVKEFLKKGYSYCSD